MKCLMAIFIVVITTVNLVFSQQLSPVTAGQGMPSIFPYFQPQQSLIPLPSTQAQPIIVPQPSQIQPPQPPQPVQISVFGEQLFLGRFAAEQFTGFNPDYQ
ncbi:MAG: hypothetical protein QW518_07615, partial [Thermofilaceae archaeon]